MSIGLNIFSDYKANAGRPHIQILLVLFRLAQAGRQEKVPKVFGVLSTVIYRIPSLFFYGIDIPVSAKIGRNFIIHHGVGLVVNSDARIGDNVTLRQGVTIGSVRGKPSPRLDDSVDVGAGAIIVGDLLVGQGAIIGAGAVVTKDVSPHARVVGNPAREL